MDIERLVLSKCLKEGTVVPLLEAHVGPEYFQKDDLRAVFELLVEHWSGYGVMPTKRVLAEQCPEFRPLQPDEPFGWYVEKLCLHYRYAIVHDAVLGAGDALDRNDPEAALSELSGALLRAGAATVDAKARTDDWEERRQRYLEFAACDGLRGIPTGYATVDRATSGLQPGQLITIVGPPKAGKSTLLLLLAKNTQEFGHTGMFLGFEMTNEEQLSRLDAFSAGISHWKLMNGRLTEFEHRLLEKAMKARALMANLDFLESHGVLYTVNSVAAKIEQLQPEVVFIDGVYMMRDEISGEHNTWIALTNITRSLKRLAQQTKRPILISTQVLESRHRRGQAIAASSIGYSSSFAQDSDVVLGIEQEQDSNTATLQVVLARAGEKRSARILFDWEEGRFAELEDTDYGEDDADEAD